MNIRRREGHEWAAGVASARGVNGATDILWIESRRSLTWRSRRAVAGVAAPPEPALPPRCSAGPRRRKWRSRRTWRRAGSAQLTYRDVSTGCLLAANETHGPACVDSGIRKSARDHRLTNKLFAPLSKNIRLRRKAVGGRGASRRGIAHTNCFPAAGRLMRAGRAGAGGGSGARAHRLPSRSARARAGRSERDRDTSLSQSRLVNTNRPRSRDKIFDLHFTRTHTRERRRRHTHTWASRIARQRRRTVAPHAVLLLTIFPENWHAALPWTRRGAATWLSMKDTTPVTIT